MIPDRAIVSMACGQVATVSGIATLLIKVPAEGRKINGGIAWFETPHFDDRIQVLVTDEDNILGYGPGTIVAGYTDMAMPDAQRGWYIPKSMGYVQIERLVDFGHLKGNFYLKVIGIKGDASSDTFRVNLHWGKSG